MPTVRAHRDRAIAMERAARALTAGVLKFLPSRQANYRVKDLKSRPCPNVHMCCSRFVHVLLCLRARCRDTPYLRQCYVSWLGCDFVSSVKRMRVSMHTTPKRQCHASIQIALSLLPDCLDLIKKWDDHQLADCSQTIARGWYLIKDGWVTLSDCFWIASRLLSDCLDLIKNGTKTNSQTTTR